MTHTTRMIDANVSTWTPGAVNRAANENGWDATDFDNGYTIVFSQTTKLATYKVVVHYANSGAITAAWLRVTPISDLPSNGDWTMLDGKVSGKRNIVIRWLAGDFDAASEYRI